MSLDILVVSSQILFWVFGCCLLNKVSLPCYCFLIVPSQIVFWAFWNLIFASRILFSVLKILKFDFWIFWTFGWWNKKIWKMCLIGLILWPNFNTSVYVLIFLKLMKEKNTQSHDQQRLRLPHSCWRVEKAWGNYVVDLCNFIFSLLEQLIVTY